jgi:AraC-like DNA-binding protein
MPTDRLASLLLRFSVTARMFHSGPLCGVTDIPFMEDIGQLHLIKRGPVDVHYATRRREHIQVPSLIFYPRAMRHRFVTDEESGADMACANLAFNAGSIDPIARSLPDVLILPLSDVEQAQPVLDLLFREAFAKQCGRQQVVDRLFEVVLILILRTLMNRGLVARGLLAGMADPRLAKSLTALHEAPQRRWSLERLAARAGMSRSHFAATFHETVGEAPGEYLANYRICVAQDLLRRGEPLKIVAGKVGYASTAALSRAFSATCGVSPRRWKAALPA